MLTTYRAAIRFGATFLALIALSATSLPTSFGQTDVSVDIATFAFNPTPLTVAAGTQVTWTNKDGIEHSVTFGTPGAPSDLFDSGFFGQNQTASFTFDQPGDFAYFCRRHPSMLGMVSVSGM